MEKPSNHRDLSPIPYNELTKDDIRHVLGGDPRMSNRTVRLGDVLMPLLVFVHFIYQEGRPITERDLGIEDVSKKHRPRSRNQQKATNNPQVNHLGKGNKCATRYR